MSAFNINLMIVSNPNFNPSPCSGYAVTFRSGEATEYIGQYKAISLAIKVVQTRLRVLGTAFGKCRLEHTETGIRAVYANNAAIEFDIEPSECDGHIKTYRGTEFPHPGTATDNTTRVELDSIDIHNGNGVVDETRWHVWFEADHTPAIHPRDLPRLIDQLQEMHDLWLEVSD
ncbi:hypothetical protein GS491_00740 [Rhodococcus hoagii]|nr:hypothetical protein [Prescottella equi]NKT03122.1 hypothetical protein [Prescottella equi]